MIAVIALVIHWGPLLIMSLVVAAGVGVWCMMVYQDAGKKGWVGFLQGFVLTFVFWIIGAGVALFVAYRQKSTKAHRIELLK